MESANVLWSTSIEFRPLSTIGMNVISPHAYTHTEYSQQNRLTPSVYGMCSSTYKVAVAVTMVVVLVVRIYFVYFFFYLLQARYVRIVLQYSTPSIPLIPFHPSSFKIIPIINDQWSLEIKEREKVLENSYPVFTHTHTHKQTRYPVRSKEKTVSVQLCRYPGIWELVQLAHEAMCHRKNGGEEKKKGKEKE